MSSFKLNQKGIAAGLLIFSVVLAGCGLMLINVSNHVTGLKSFSETWLSTDGVIQSVGIASKKEKSIPDVKYTFTVKDKTYESDRLYLTQGPYEDVILNGETITVKVMPPVGTEAEKLTLEKGQKVTVYYNPHVPQESTLVRYGLGDLKRFMLLGIIGIIVGLALMAKALTTEEFE